MQERNGLKTQLITHWFSHSLSLSLSHPLISNLNTLFHPFLLGLYAQLSSRPRLSRPSLTTSVSPPTHLDLIILSHFKHNKIPSLRPFIKHFLKNLKIPNISFPQAWINQSIIVKIMAPNPSLATFKTLVSMPVLAPVFVAVQFLGLISV